jgi:hypothetical protein
MIFLGTSSVFALHGSDSVFRSTRSVLEVGDVAVWVAASVSRRTDA